MRLVGVIASDNQNDPARLHAWRPGGLAAGSSLEAVLHNKQGASAAVQYGILAVACVLVAGNLVMLQPGSPGQ